MWQTAKDITVGLVVTLLALAFAAAVGRIMYLLVLRTGQERAVSTAATVGVTALLALLTAAYVLVTWRIAQGTRDSAAASRKSAEATHRLVQYESTPLVVARAAIRGEVMQPPPRGDTSEQVRWRTRAQERIVIVENVGRAGALHVELMVVPGDDEDHAAIHHRVAASIQSGESWWTGLDQMTWQTIEDQDHILKTIYRNAFGRHFRTLVRRRLTQYDDDEHPGALEIDTASREGPGEPWVDEHSTSSIASLQGGTAASSGASA